MKHYIRTILPGAALAVAMASCTEITDYPDGSIEFDEIFESEKLTAGWLNSCYTPLVGSSFGSAYGANMSFLDAATDNAHDVDDVEGGPISQWNNGLATISSNPLTALSKWSSYYGGIARPKSLRRVTVSITVPRPMACVRYIIFSLQKSMAECL